MGNEKNINSRDKKSSKGEEKNYDFIRETIKNRSFGRCRNYHWCDGGVGVFGGRAETCEKIG